MPVPHHISSRTANVAFTSLRRAARMLSRLTNRCRTLRSVASLSPCLPVTATRLIPMFVPSPNRTSSSRRRSTSLDRFSRVATEVNSAMKSVSNSAYFGCPTGRWPVD